ncbi:MAG: four helix bundle protein [Candidatus Acidiferrum sp.]
MIRSQAAILPPNEPKRKIQRHQDLLVWQKSMDLVVESYRLAQLLPINKQYGLASQMRRASVSVPANIAEGDGRWHKKEFLRFLLLANGSLKELETHLEIGRRLSFFASSELSRALKMADEIGRMLTSLRGKLDR